MTWSPASDIAAFVLASAVRIAVGLIFLAVVTAVGVSLLALLLPFRVLRIKVTNGIGRIVGPSILWLSGCTIRVDGREHSKTGTSAIFCGNHTSILDAFTSIWLSPMGTVGVAKKQIVFYPFYGLAWIMAGHLLVDRAHTDRAKRSLARAGEFVRKNRLSLFMWPEGTRSPDGRLLGFRKGIVHLAIQTGFPIVPMVTVGAQNAWRKGSLRLEPTRIHIRFLPPLSTNTWRLETIDQHLEELRAAFIEALPENQRPPSKTALAA